MTAKRISPRRIEVNYAGVQSSFWLSQLAYTGFAAVFLASKGFSDTQIGVTSSLMSVISILFQLFTSSFSDMHNHIPIKKVMTVVFLLAMACGAVILALPLPIDMMMIVYSVGGAFQNTNVGLMNAQIMQYVNAGMNVNYGWPRGMSSLIYAVGAYVLGELIAKYSPAILMPLFLLILVMCVAMVMLMPNIVDISRKNPALFVQEKYSGRTTYREMLMGNRVLLLFLIASVVLYVGQSPASLFLVRIVQEVGGGSSQLGISMLLQSGVEMPTMFLTPLLLRRFKARDILLVSFAAYIAKMIMLYTAGSVSGVYMAMGISILCYGLYGIASVFFVNSIVRPGEKVRAQALVILSSNMGSILGNLIGGVMLDSYGLKPLLGICWIIVLVAGIFMGVCARTESKQETIPKTA